MAFRHYIDARRENLESALKSELSGATCPRMDRLYELSITVLTATQYCYMHLTMSLPNVSARAGAAIAGRGSPPSGSGTLPWPTIVDRLHLRSESECHRIEDPPEARRDRPRHWDAQPSH